MIMENQGFRAAVSTGHGVHLCSKCGWPFPNPHPSAKHRRAHKKVCGSIDGYKLTQPELNNLAISEEEEQQQQHMSDEGRTPSPEIEDRSLKEVAGSRKSTATRSEDEHFSDAMAEFSDSGLRDMEKFEEEGDGLLKVDATIDDPSKALQIGDLQQVQSEMESPNASSPLGSSSNNVLDETSGQQLESLEPKTLAVLAVEDEKEMIENVPVDDVLQEGDEEKRVFVEDVHMLSGDEEISSLNYPQDHKDHESLNSIIPLDRDTTSELISSTQDDDKSTLEDNNQVIMDDCTQLGPPTILDALGGEISEDGGEVQTEGKTDMDKQSVPTILDDIRHPIEEISHPYGSTVKNDEIPGTCESVPATSTLDTTNILAMEDESLQVKPLGASGDDSTAPHVWEEDKQAIIHEGSGICSLHPLENDKEEKEEEEDDKTGKQQDGGAILGDKSVASSSTTSLEANWGSVSALSIHSEAPEKSSLEKTTTQAAINPHKLDDIVDQKPDLEIDQNAQKDPSDVGSEESQPGKAQSEEERITKVTNWKQQHTPLKNLLGEAKSPIKGEAATSSSKTTTIAATVGNSVLRSEDGLKEVDKEWNSPARYRPSVDIKKGRKKGKTYWVPFACCSSSSVH